MASIFLSYARGDLAKAQRIARLFEAAGHSVWWDRQLHAGTRFTAEIDEQLGKADAIIVLWSQQSVESAWVQDEAAVGRDSGRLFPVLLESVVPPLGFRQYQAVDLTRWSGRGRPGGLAELLEAIEAKSPAKATPLEVLHSPETSNNRRRWQIAAAMGALLAIVGCSTWWFLQATGPPTLAVEAADSAATGESHDFATEVGLDLTRFHPASLEALNILDNSQSRGRAHFRVGIALNRNGNVAHADLSLKVQGRPGVAWAEGMDGSADKPAILRQQAASSLVPVLGCAIEADASGVKLSTATYQQFIEACAAVKADYSATPAPDLVPVFRQIARSAPNFAPGFALLALSEFDIVTFLTNAEPEQLAMIREGKAALKRARDLDPALEEVLAAEAIFHPFDKDQWNHAFPIIDRGLKLHPNSALLLGLKSKKLMSVGRMTEAANAARDALGFEPLSPRTHAQLVDALAYSNRIPAAYDELGKAEAIWPDAETLADERYRIDLRFGDPRQALAKVQSASGDAAVHDQGWKNFIAARMNPSAATIDSALQSFRDRYRLDPADISSYLQALGTFGRVDDAFQAVANPVTIDSLEAATDILFRPNMRSIRNDPRFMGLAAKLGLVTFWKQSANWPDFCYDPELPYNCKAEAAKYR